MIKQILLIFAIYTLISCSTVKYILDKNTSLWNINAHPGDALTLALPGNPTTGYSWYICSTIDNKVIQPLNLDSDNSCKTYMLDQQSNLLGSGGKFYFYFTALKAGNLKIKFEYKKPWYSPEDDTRVVTANIRIGSEFRTTDATDADGTTAVTTGATYGSFVCVGLFTLMLMF
jgi:predicted secreted protein